MHIKSIYLKNFRVYKEELFTFTPQINVIYGGNAAGKTSLLEAIYYLIAGRSFRTEKSQDLIASGENYFYIEAQFEKHGVSQTLKVSYDQKMRKIIYNSTKLQSATNLLGILQGVLLTPDDIDLVKGSPAIRRHFFDLQIAQVDPLYIHYLTRYAHAMKQRNCLLRTKQMASIEIFELEMAKAAAYIILQRHILVKELEILSASLHENLSGTNEILNFNYKTNAGELLELNAIRDFFVGQFKKNRPREMDFGMTLSGPHKDDLNIFLNSKEARNFASEGQKRCLVSSLRLSEWFRLKDRSEAAPLMLIDDFGISLDDGRKEKLLTKLENFDQVFITATEVPEIYRSKNLNNLIEII